MEYEKSQEIEDYRKKVFARKGELCKEFADKARERRESTIELQKTVEQVKKTILSKIEEGQNDEALEYIKENIYHQETKPEGNPEGNPEGKPEGNPEGKLPGPVEEFLTDGVVDKAKVEDRLSMMREAVDERLEEIDEFMVGDWEGQIEEMLEAPFFEMDQLIVQYCYGDEAVRTPYQILEECEEYWDSEFEWRKKKLGAIERFNRERPVAEHDEMRKRVVAEVIQLKKDILGEDWERISAEAYGEYEKEEKIRKEKEEKDAAERAAAEAI